MRYVTADVLFTLTPQDSLHPAAPFSLASPPEILGSPALAWSGKIPIRNPQNEATLVLEDDGTIRDILPFRMEDGHVEVFSGALCPGFINAHTHLELSHLRGKIPEKTGLVNFILEIQKIRGMDPEIIQQSLENGYREMELEGIMGFGDISNSPDSFLQKSKGTLNSHTFLECYGFNPDRVEEVWLKALSLKTSLNQLGPSASIVPHAPYSVSRELFFKIRNHESGFQSIHNQESQQENQFYKTGTGDFKCLYDSFNLDISYYKPYGRSSIEVYFPWMGPQKRILVHNTFSERNDIQVAQGPNTYWCFCPRANLFIESRLPDILEFKAQFGQVLIGTDSMASNHSFSILEEIKTIQKLFPEISLNQLLVWASRNGAEFFEWSELGSFEKGKRPGILNILDLTPEGQLSSQSSVHRII